MKKWIITTSIMVVILAVGAGSLYYYLNIKEYKTADSKVDDIVKTNYDIKLPDEDTSKSSSRTEAKEQNVSQTVENVSSNSGSVSMGVSAVATKSKTPPAQIKVTAASIISKYQPAFIDLESQADSKLNNLLSYAFSEYQEKKSNGEDISYFYFYSKYNGAAKRLEASTDNSFSYIYNALVKDLESSGYGVDEAEPIKNHYLSMKKQKRSALMNKAMGVLN